MRLKSIKEKQYTVIVLSVLLILIAGSHYYLDRVLSSSEYMLYKIIVLEKTFSDILLQEIPLAHDPSRHEALTNKYAKLRKNFADILSDTEDDLLANRRYAFDKKFFIDREAAWLNIVVHETFFNLLASVRYIHEHHIGYLKNLLRRGATRQDYDIGESFQRSPVKSAPEIEIIKTAVYIQTSLFDINNVFNEIEKGSNLGKIKEKFSEKMKQFYSLINTFESYSLDAQDGILAEELLINGRRFEKLFSNWVVIEKNKRALIIELEEKRESLFKFLKVKSENINKSNKRTKRIVKNMQFISNVLTIFLVSLLIFFGRRVTREITKTATETERIQNDISYQIRIDDSTSNEFKTVFNALNSMAYNLNYNTQQLKESEEKYRTVLEANPDPVIVYDMGGKIIYFNPAFSTVFGWALEERLGQKMDDFIPDANWAETREMINKVLAGESFFGFKTCRYNKKGEIITVRISGSIYKDINGKPIGSVINLRDISDQNILEAQIQQSQKLEAIGTLAGGIAHDFNNILSGIFGYTQLLHLKTKKGDKSRLYLDSLLTAANRAKDLVNQILTFSRQSAGETNPMEIQPVIKESLKLILASLPTTISIHQSINEDCGLIMANQTQVHQIVMNLCTNAFHAMEETGGELSVNLEEVELAATDLKDQVMEPGKYVKLTVADKGIGIDKNEVSRIFDPYFTTKEKGKGTGLGLAVTHGIVRNYGGHIRVDSEPGKGTAFHVYLPVIKALQETTQIDTQPMKNGNERVLLVDDQKDVLDIEQQILETLGYQVTIKTSSLDALNTFRTNPDNFDLVVTDMTMPNITGDKLALELMKMRPDIPIVLCTGFSEKISEKEAISLGIKGFIMKPAAIGDWSAVIRKVLDDK